MTSKVVRNPRLSMVLTIQPVVLEKLMSDKYNRGQGICARILYAMCDFNSLVGHRKAKPDTIAPKVKAEYENFILKSLSSEYSGIIELSPEADELRCEFSEKIEPKFQDEWIDMQDWVQKLAGTAVRIAGLIHAAEAEGDPTQEPVSGEEMRRAITIAEFLSAHAEAAYRNSCPSKTDADAIYLEKRLRENGKEEITKRDLHQMCRGRFKEAEEMDPALQILSEKNYIRMEIIRTGGRPSKKILVNPRILEDKVSEKTSRALTA